MFPLIPGSISIWPSIFKKEFAMNYKARYQLSSSTLSDYSIITKRLCDIWLRATRLKVLRFFFAALWAKVKTNIKYSELQSSKPIQRIYSMFLFFFAQKNLRIILIFLLQNIAYCSKLGDKIVQFSHNKLTCFAMHRFVGCVWCTSYYRLWLFRS